MSLTQSLSSSSSIRETVGLLVNLQVRGKIPDLPQFLTFAKYYLLSIKAVFKSLKQKLYITSSPDGFMQTTSNKYRFRNSSNNHLFSVCPVTLPPLPGSLPKALCTNTPAFEHLAANCSHLRPSEAELEHWSYLACTEYRKWQGFDISAWET